MNFPLSQAQLWLSLICALAFIAPAARAQSPAPAAGEIGVDLRGALPSPHRVTATELQRLPRTEVHTKDAHNGGKDVVFSGVLLIDVLKAAGLTFEPGMPGSRKTVRTSLLVEAADGYRVIFGLGELDPTLTDCTILVADTKDGGPLGPEGPLRLVVPGDKRQARWVRQLTSVTVRQD